MNGYSMKKEGDSWVFTFTDYEEMRSFLTALGVTTIYFANGESGYKVKRENFKGGTIILSYVTTPQLELVQEQKTNDVLATEGDDA